MEFAVCKSGVKDIKSLKDKAKALGRAKGLALHKSLDIIASEEGYESGWHELVMSKWSLDGDMSLQKVDIPNQVLMKIVFPAIRDEDNLRGATGISGYISRELDGRKPVDVIHLESLHDGQGLTSDERSELLMKELSRESKFRLRCMLAIHSAERALFDPEASATIPRITNVQRRLYDARKDANLPTHKTIHQGIFESSRPTVAFEALPSRRPAEVAIVYIAGDTSGVTEIPRDKWINLMEEVTQTHGDPREDRDACIAMLEGAGVSFQVDLSQKISGADGLSGP